MSETEEEYESQHYGFSIAELKEESKKSKKKVKRKNNLNSE